ncbi:MAG: acyl-CoA thioesterase [Pseudomonadota bacterium]
MNEQVEDASTPTGELAVRTVAMPADTNANGDIFGGWVLSQMDIAGAVCARQRARGRVATVAINAMSFIRPVQVGDVLCVYAQLAREGRSSMVIHLEAWALRIFSGKREKVTDGEFTFVSIDEAGRAHPLPSIDEASG